MNTTLATKNDKRDQSSFQNPCPVKMGKHGKSVVVSLHSFVAISPLKIGVIILLATISAANRGYCAQIEFFVSPEGNDVHPGTKALPFETFEAARDAVRRSDRNQQRIVWLRAGVYELDKPLVLTAENSGSPGRPVVYRAWPGEKVRVVGGKQVTGFEPVVDRTILSRLVPEARSRILQVDLKAIGIEDYGTAKGGGLELFFDDKPMTFELSDNSPAYKLGFEPIPFDRIGLFEDEHRTELVPK